MLILFNISFFITFKYIEKNFQPTVKALATSQSQTFIMSTIDESVEEIPDIFTNYSELCYITKNEKGEIISITTNTNIINKIKLNLSENIVERIKHSHLQNLGIPIGNLTNTYILSGRGPKIPIKILTSSSPEIHIESKFESAGVNQTKHKISIITNIKIQIILPNETLHEQVSYEALLSETIIVGKVPDVYVSK